MEEHRRTITSRALSGYVYEKICGGIQRASPQIFGPLILLHNYIFFNPENNNTHCTNQYT